MIHPSQLLRTNSERSQFAPRSNLQTILNQNDCGISILPCLAKRFRLDKFYKITVFVALLTTLAILDSASSTYFNGTTKVWRQNYKVSEQTAEWTVYLSLIFGGALGLVLAHYGNGRRPSYIGGLAMLQAVAGWLLIVPEIYHPRFEHFNTTAAVIDQQLCRQTISLPINVDYDEGKQYIALSLIVVFQLLTGLAFISLMTHGISYIDDGSAKLTVDIFICLVVVGCQIGRFAGLNLTLIPIAFNRSIFFSIAWLTMMSSVFLLGFLTSLFSKYPKKMILAYGVDALLNARNSIIPESIGFWKSLASILSSKLQLINVFSATAMNIAMVNFAAFREEFFRSRFINFTDELDYHFSFYTMSQMIFMCLLVTVLAIIFSKRKLSSRFFVWFIIVAYILIIILFGSYAFIECEDQLDLDVNYKLISRACNAPCRCSLDVFAPVCMEGRTYYSACYAGCTQIANSRNEYMDCRCAVTKDALAKEGSCNQEKCTLVSFIAEANNVLAFGFKISAFIIHVIIALRTVKTRSQKALSLGFLLSIYVLLPFLPFKVFFEIIKGDMCSHWSKIYQDCVIFKEEFPLAICIFTISLMTVGLLLAFAMLPLTKSIKSFRRTKSINNLRRAELDNLNGITTLHEASNEDDESEDEDDITLNSLQRHSTIDSVGGSSQDQSRRSEGYTDGDIDEELQRISKPPLETKL